MRKIRIHPVFILLLVLLLLRGLAVTAVFSVLAVLLHEYAHYRAALSRCYLLNRLTLMPYGAVLGGEECIKPNDDAFITVWGPLSNIITAVVMVASWWVFPSLYPYTHCFFKANIAIAAFNILPAYPLDGARLLLARSKNRLKTLKWLRISGLIFSALAAILFIATAFVSINYVLAIISILLAFGALSGTKKEKYVYLCNCISCVDNRERPVEIKKLAVGENMPLKKIVLEQRPYILLEIEVVDSSGRLVERISPDKFGRLLESNPLNTPILQALRKH